MNQLLADLFVYLSYYLDSDNMKTQTTVIFEEIYSRLQDKSLTNIDRLEVLYKNFLKYAQNDDQILKLKDWIMGNDTTLEGR